MKFNDAEVKITQPLISGSCLQILDPTILLVQVKADNSNDIVLKMSTKDTKDIELIFFLRLSTEVVTDEGPTLRIKQELLVTFLSGCSTTKIIVF